MGINIEILTYTILAVGVVTELLKINKLNKNILATVATVLGSLVFIAMSGFTIPNAIIGAVLGASSSGLYDLVKGLQLAFDLGSIFNNKKTKEESEDTTTEEGE